MTKKEFLINECWGLMLWPLNAALALYNNATTAAIICTFFFGVTIGLAIRDIRDIK